METESYLREKNFEFKRARDQYCLRICPICNDEKWHFYISESGVWTCHKCQAKGNLYQLKKHMGDVTDNSNDVKSLPQVIGKSAEVRPLDVVEHMKHHEDLLKNPGTMRYLTAERGFNEDTIKYFKLGLKKEDKTNWLLIPHFSGDRLVNIKYRSLPPAEKAFKREPGCPSILFNQDCLKDGFTEIFLCESETDAMSLWKNDFKNVVASTCGAGSFLPEWHQALEGIEEIYICFDPDEAGQKGSQAVANRLGFERCKNIVLPAGQDLNDFFKTHSKDDFLKLALQAKRFTIPSISSIGETISKLQTDFRDRPQRTGILTPWDNVNRHIKSFEPGDLIILSAIPKTGKTTFALNIAYHNTQQNIPCLFYCLEMRPERLLVKILSMVLDREIDAGNKEEVTKAINEARGTIEQLPLYFGYSYKRTDLDFVLNTIRSAVKRFDILFVTFDNLHFLVRDLRNTTQQVALVTQSFKLLAEELEIPIMLIAQPRKTNPNDIMTMIDLKDSASIGADADQIIILHRRRIESKHDVIHEELMATYEPETLVRIEASRYNPGGDTLLFFDGAKSKFRKLDD